MIPPDALQIVIICHAEEAEEGDFPRPKDYTEAIGNSFVRQETNELVRVLSLVDTQGTGATVRRFYVNGFDLAKPLPPFLPSDIDNSLHTLIVVLITPAIARDNRIVVWLETISVVIKNSKGRHAFLVLGTSEQSLSSFRRNKNATTLREPQGISLEKLTEYALRPAYASIMALSAAHRLLKKDTASWAHTSNRENARFFISHAKLDGLPLAHSLSHLLTQLSWLEQFYDAKDIQSGDDFKEILERGVLGSMLLVLRSDIYDLRFWCRQEVLWAESYDRPVLLVDARTELLNRASTLGFAGVPGVRIPDGNLVRVVTEGLREWVRIGVLHRRYIEVVAPGSDVSKNTELLSRAPSLTSLAEAIKRLKVKTSLDANVKIVYSDPPLDSTHHNAVQDLIGSTFINGQVLSFRSFLATLP